MVSPATSPAQYPAGSGVCGSVLVREPHGFEGFGVIPEKLHEEQFALAHGVDARHLQVCLRATAYAAPDEPHNDSTSGVDEVADRVQCIAVEGLAQLLPLAHYLLPTHERPRL